MTMGLRGAKRGARFLTAPREAGSMMVSPLLFELCGPTHS